MSCSYLLTFCITNYNTFHDKHSIIMTTLPYSKYEPFTYLPMNCKNAVLGERFFSALGHSRNYPYPLHRENWKDPLFPHPTDISPPPKGHLGIKSSWFKFTNILLPKSIHTSNTNSFLHHVNPFSNLYLHASPPFRHLKIFLLSSPWIAQIFHVHELWVFSGMTHYRILTFYKRQRYLLYNTLGKRST